MVNCTSRIRRDSAFSAQFWVQVPGGISRLQHVGPILPENTDRDVNGSRHKPRPGFSISAKIVTVMKVFRDRLGKSSPAKFFFALACGREEYLPEVEKRLISPAGALEFRSELYRFSDFSSYYDSETGGEVWKYLAGAEGVLSPEEIVRIKRVVEGIQERFLFESDGTVCRQVNIDPGYINGWQVVLASVKNFTHRIYLGRGVYAETTLLYQKGAFQSLPWTYADYASRPVQEFLKMARDEWSRQVTKF